MSQLDPKTESLVQQSQATIAKNRVWVKWQGRVYSLPLQESTSRGAAGAGTQELIAPFPCKVVKLHVTVGQSVKTGDPVISVEAMKMEYTYNSPRDGVIAKIPADVGVIVPEGSAFVEWKKS